MQARGSESSTQGVRITTRPFYLDSQSNPDEKRFVFGYQIEITNDSPEVVTLLWRRWIIIDGAGESREVQGSGVIGKQPRLEPGESFQYQSFCPLTTEWGTMEGSFTMQRESGELFEAEVARFVLGTDEEDED